ncbi:hypothetical protein [Arthrobacter sp. USHLN218]|uniref:hypothetical protein n=1 Tax=Arthrobacter sp. USHLN218 TaxID=3081232 RepID=UPI003017350B
MTVRPVLSSLAMALLLAVTACTGGTEDAPSAADHGDWASQQFNEERWGSPGASIASGYITPGSEVGTQFTPTAAGWQAIGIACQGPGSVTVTVSNADGELGSGTVGCGTEVTTTMELPVGQVTITVDRATSRGM